MPRPFVHPRGFTLIELMVAVVIAGILAAVAYPAYTSHMARGRRAGAIAALTAVVQAQERWRSNNGAYTTDFGATGLNLSISAITPLYTVAVTGVGDPPSLLSGYIATATPVAGGLQTADQKCATLSVQLTGANLSYLATSSGGDDTSNQCWPK